MLKSLDEQTTVLVGTRVTPDEAEAIRRIAEAQGRTVSGLIRHTLRQVVLGGHEVLR